MCFFWTRLLHPVQQADTSLFHCLLLDLFQTLLFNTLVYIRILSCDGLCSILLTPIDIYLLIYLQIEFSAKGISNVSWLYTMRLHMEPKQQTKFGRNQDEKDAESNSILTVFFDEENIFQKFISSCFDISTFVLLSGMCFFSCASLLTYVWRTLLHSTSAYSLLALHLASIPEHNNTFSAFMRNTSFSLLWD